MNCLQLQLLLYVSFHINIFLSYLIVGEPSAINPITFG